MSANITHTLRHGERILIIKTADSTKEFYLKD